MKIPEHIKIMLHHLDVLEKAQSALGDYEDKTLEEEISLLKDDIAESWHEWREG